MKTWMGLLASMGISLSMLSQPAAAESGLFLGASTGYSDVEWSELEDDTFTQAYVGYNVIDWLGFEAGASDLGTFNVKHGTNSLDVKANHIAIDFYGDFGYWDLGVYAKVGLYDAEIERTCANCTGDDKVSNSGFTYAAGLSYELIPHFELTGGWQFFHKLGDETEIQLYQIGVRFQF